MARERSLEGVVTPSRPAAIVATPCLALTLLLTSMAVLAHGESATSSSWLLAWPVSVDAWIAIGLAAVVYGRGLKVLSGKRDRSRRGHALAFYAGLAAVGLALLTPVDVISEHVFAVHQIQHLLLRGIAPMLLMLAVPSGPLIAGLPVALRRAVLAPLMASRSVRATFALLAGPFVGTALYVGVLYFWQWPPAHNLALLNSGWHYLMHVAMLASGLLVFWTVFDPRPAPWGATFPTRLIMLGAAIFANIPLGAVITLKDEVSYAAYDALGRWWGVTPLGDELLGGMVIWILGSMMGLIAVLILVRLWGRTEDRQERRRSRGFQVPVNRDLTEPGADHAAAARRRLGWALALVPAAVLIAVFVLATWLSWRPDGHEPDKLRVTAVTAVSFDADHAPGRTPT